MLRSNPNSYISRIALFENSLKEEYRQKYKWDSTNKLPEEISKEEEKYKHPDYEGRMNAHKCREGMSQEIDREKLRLKHEWCLLLEDFEHLSLSHHKCIRVDSLEGVLRRNTSRLLAESKQSIRISYDKNAHNLE